jgi:hypothetical protein
LVQTTIPLLTRHPTKNLTIEAQTHTHHGVSGGRRVHFQSIKEGAEGGKKTGVFCRAFS